MTTAQDQQSRAEFEAHMRKLSPCVRLYRHTCDGGDKYRTVTVQRNWELWQAARALPAGVEPVAFKVTDPGEPDIGFWLSETKGTRWQVSEALYTAAQLQAMGRVPMNPSLLARCTEIQRWQKTGLLTGEALRTYAAEKYPGDAHALQMAEADTAREAYRVLTATTGPQAATAGAGGVTAGAAQFAPLTDERIRQLDDATKFHESHTWSIRFARAIEAELRKKVTP